MKEPQQPTKKTYILSLSRSQVNSQPNYILESSEKMLEKKGNSSFFLSGTFYYKRHICLGFGSTHLKNISQIGSFPQVSGWK